MPKELKKPVLVVSIPQIVDGNISTIGDHKKRKKCDFSVFHKVNCPYSYGSNYLILSTVPMV